MNEEMQKMVEWIKKDLAFVRENATNNPFNGRLEPEFVSCDPEKKEIVLQFPVQQWELNGIGTLHGGVIASMADFVMCMIAYYYAPVHIPPTISQTVNYHRPVPRDCKPLFKVKLTSLSKRVAAAYCEVIIPETGVLACTSTGTYSVTLKKD